MNNDEIAEIMGHRDITKGSWTTDGKINELDMNQFSDDTVWMVTNKGGWCFIPVRKGVYECHFGYTRQGLRRFAFNHTRQCFDIMQKRGAKTLVGMVASGNTLAKRFLEKIGCKSVDRKDGPFKFAGNKTDLEIYLWQS